MAENQSQDGVDTQWADAGARHEDRVLRAQAQVKNWRLFAFFCLALVFFISAGNIYIGSKSKFIPMVFEVDKLGQVVAVKALSGDDAISDPLRIVYSEMFDLMENCRSVTTDRGANDARISKCFSRLTGAAKIYARTELLKAKPNDVGQSKTVQVTVRSALKVSDKSWQIDWDEQSRNLQGEEMGAPEHWRATVKYELTPSPEESVFRRNAIGFYINEMSWQKVIR